MEATEIVTVGADNIEAVWPAVVAAVTDAAFVAIDTEFTGIGTASHGRTVKPFVLLCTTLHISFVVICRRETWGHENDFYHPWLGTAPGLRDKDVSVRYVAWRAAVLSHTLLQLGVCAYLPPEPLPDTVCGCGTSFLADSKFCRECGTKRPAPPPVRGRLPHFQQ